MVSVSRNETSCGERVKKLIEVLGSRIVKTSLLRKREKGVPPGAGITKENIEDG